MKFWNYIGEFFLFRWLFGSHKHDETRYKSISSDNRDRVSDMDSHIGLKSHYNNNYSRFESHDYVYSQSYDDFHDEQDDYDLMDDDF